MMRRRFSLPFLGATPLAPMLALLLCALFAGDAHAQDSSLSLDDAKRITAAMEAQGFTAPPRSIADITAVLDQAKPDPAKAAAAKALADAQPPAGISGADAARFYFERGSAAGDIGRSAQRLADYHKAVELLEPLRSSYTDLYLTDSSLLALAETRAGRLRDAMALREQDVQIAGSDRHVAGHIFSDGFNLTRLYVQLGDFAAAHAMLGKLDDMMQESQSWHRGGYKPRILWRSFVDWAHASVLDAEGKLADAERGYRQVMAELAVVIEDAKAGLDKAPPGTRETSLDSARRDLALNLARQGRLIEAEVEARQALLSELHMRGSGSDEVAQLVISLGAVIADEGRYADAEKLHRAAIAIYLGLGHGPDSVVLNYARRNLAGTLAAGQKWTAALQQFDQIKQGLAADPQLLHRIVGTNIAYALAAHRAGRTADALAIARATYEGRAKLLGEKHYDTAEARGVYAAALAASGDHAGALAAYRATLPILLQASRQSDDNDEAGGAKTVRFRLILEDYLALLSGQADGATRAETFYIADAARGGAVQRALTASAARAAARDPTLADLVRREQDAQKQAAALTGLIANVLALPPDQQDAKSVDALRAQIDQLRSARATLRQEIGHRFPEYANLIDPRPATVDDAQKALEPGEALIATYVADDRTYVWALPKQGALAFAAVPLKRAELEAMVAQLRKALDPDASTLAEIPPFDVTLAYRLYSLLLKPVEPGWRGAKSLLVVSHGALGQIPLALLVTQPASLEPEPKGEAPFANYRKIAWLLRQVAITDLPSVDSLETLRRIPPAAAGRKPFVGFGDPWFSTQQAAAGEADPGDVTIRGAPKLGMRGIPLHLRNLPKTETIADAGLAQLPRLPETAEEVREVALALKADPVADVYLGAKANEHQVRSMKLDDRRVVMFATHGLIPGDLDGLAEPALALSAPQVAGTQGDGLLTMTKILGLKLDADWIVLSACNTAAGEGAGAEAVSGLGLAFFYAGTRAILVSNWPVETNSARALTTDLFRRQAENPSLSRAEALRQTMLAMIDKGGRMGAKQTLLFSYAHPIFWAPFSLVGDGGSGPAS
jgi:CHAT domain-containing protein